MPGSLEFTLIEETLIFVNRKNKRIEFFESGSFVKITMNDEPQKTFLNFIICLGVVDHIFKDLIEGENKFDGFGADIISIVSKIGIELNLVG